jgi:hypothetical protein
MFPGPRAHLGLGMQHKQGVEFSIEICSPVCRLKIIMVDGVDTSPDARYKYLIQVRGACSHVSP